jgi:hypothetical protein
MMDLQQTEGVIRDDILELLCEMGFDDRSKPCQRYLERGEGILQERKRMGGTGMQESLSLLAELVLRTPPPKLEEGMEAPPDPRTLVGPGVELLRKKVRGIAPVSAGAQALKMAMQPAEPPEPLRMSQMVAPALNPQQLQDTQRPSSAGLPSKVDDGDDDVENDADQLRLEAARLKRLEEDLMARLESRGSLFAAEEARLRDIRAQRAALQA